jgi:class 3 adenylate cyclase
VWRRWPHPIGDTVNLAARLEIATKELGADIVVNEETHSAVCPYFKPLGELSVKGRATVPRICGRGVIEACRTASS